ncbi:PilZ domain-containing protein [Bradyrhizobium sp. CCBAU 11357]|uniref:PilZ domain-containing protein n=1 Tax=Bradyrhizobium sp. CCBAU 11357 TaxID=1630808 RepID=UPI003FA48989
MLDRRASKRLSVNQPALLRIREIRGVHPCVVRNLSEEGACLSSPVHIFADELDLSVDGFKSTLRCQVVWRDEHLYGVKFKVGNHTCVPL